VVVIKKFLYQSNDSYLENLLVLTGCGDWALTDVDLPPLDRAEVGIPDRDDDGTNPPERLKVQFSYKSYISIKSV
jgi:hypothetical protein